MSKSHVLITDYVDPVLITGLKKLNFQVTYAPEIKLDTVHQVIGSFVGIVINTKIKTDKSLLEKGGQLRFVARLGSGKDIIDLNAAEELGVHVITSPEGNRNAVAEHAMGMLLALANNILRADREIRSFYWNRERNRGFELAGKTIGIIGFGNTGRAFAEKFENWRTSVLSYDKYKEQYATDLRFVTETNLQEIQQKADVISFHLPLTEETHHMLNSEFITRCKDGVIIVNTSRGKVIDEEALIEGLRSGKIAGACLDVFENEKTETHTKKDQKRYAELYEMDCTVLTPHVAGWTRESKRKIAETILEKVADFIALKS